MYSSHVPKIAKAMKADCDLFKHALLFVTCSIRQQIVTVPDQLEAIDRGDLSPLWGFKMATYNHLEEHGASLWRNVREADLYTALYHMTRVPGLGIVKGAFACQLMGHDIACMDSRNVKRLGAKPREWRTDGKAVTPKRLRAYLRRYSGQGRGKLFWDAWCNDVGLTYGIPANTISAMHLTAIQPGAPF